MSPQGEDEATFLLYGATGFTGGLVARAAARFGLRPILAGRDPRRVAALGRELGLDHRAFPLTDRGALLGALGDVAAVLHCAGPFIHTYRPMVEACLGTGTHYMDVTGEIPVFAGLLSEDVRARDAGILLLPGVGFDVVASDCLAAHLKARLPTAALLRLAFRSGGRPSRGTALTMLEHGLGPGRVRKEGEIVEVPQGWKTLDVDLGSGPETAITIPWGDVFTAYHTTGIPDVEVYIALPFPRRALVHGMRFLGWALDRPRIRGWLRRRIRAAPPGPSAEERRTGESRMWGMAADPAGRRVEARLRGPEGYTFTVETSLRIVKRVLGGEAPAGFRTPAGAFGPELVLEVPGVHRTDVGPPAAFPDRGSSPSGAAWPHGPPGP